MLTLLPNYITGMAFCSAVHGQERTMHAGLCQFCHNPLTQARNRNENRSV